MRVLVTRPLGQGEETADLIRGMDGTPLVIPPVRIARIRSAGTLRLVEEALDAELDYLVFMSVNGVEAFSDLARKSDQSHNFPSFSRDVTVVCVGPKTAAKAEDLGIPVDFFPSEYSSEGLTRHLREHDLRGKKIGLVRSKEANDGLHDYLQEAESEVSQEYFYELKPLEASRVLHVFIGSILEGKVDVVAFTSSSISTTVFEASRDLGVWEEFKSALDDVLVAALGPTTAETLEAESVDPDVVPEEYTIHSLLGAVASHVE